MCLNRFAALLCVYLPRFGQQLQKPARISLGSLALKELGTKVWHLAKDAQWGRQNDREHGR
jgi:hypothetical protein